MILNWHLLVPLACAFVYVVGAMTLKRAAALGVGAWRTSFIANWTMFIAFVPFWLGLGGQVHPLADYWQPALVALVFLGGQALIFVALNLGDVSVTTPVMGCKVILVALFSSVLHAGDVPLRWWIGAALSASAVLLLHVGDRHGERRRVGLTVLLAGFSSVCYSLSDVLMQKWVPAWGVGSFFPPMFLALGLFSCGFIPLFHAPLSALDARAWRWVGLGGILLALNNTGIVLAIGWWGGATAVNIVYSARGLLSVVLVWAIGHWFASEEKALEPRVLRFRIAGAALMLAAIALVLV